MRLRVDLAHLAVDPKEHIHGRCGGKEQCPACQARDLLRKRRNDVAHLLNAAMRMHWLVDALLIDRYRLESGATPKGKEQWNDNEKEIATAVRIVCGSRSDIEQTIREAAKKSDRGSSYLYTYPVLRRMMPWLASGITASIAQTAQKKWQSVRTDALLIQKLAPPHYKNTVPIPLRSADYSLRPKGDAYEMAFSLSASTERKGREFSLKIEARDDRQEELLAALTGGNVRLGAASLAEDRLRPGRWYLTFSYRKRVPKTEATGSAALNKGLTCFLAAVTHGGEQWVHDGDEIEAYVRQTERRRKEHQRQLKASGRGGHGRIRSLQPIEVLSGKAERWRQTRCQTIARRFVSWLVTKKIRRLYIDDFSGIRDQPPERLDGGKWIWDRIQSWPAYQLQTRIESCCEEVGIEAIVRTPRHPDHPEKGIQITCPRCAHASAENLDYRKRRFRCVECKFTRHMDVAASMNNLAWGELERFGDAARPVPTPSGNGKAKRASNGTARKRAPRSVKTKKD